MRLQVKDRLIAYANSGSKEAIETLLENVDNPSAHIRAVAIYHLSAIRNISLDSILKRARDNNDLVRQAVAYTLQYFPSEHASLLSLLKDSSSDVRRQACLSLGEC